jgi:hypothetical protein
MISWWFDNLYSLQREGAANTRVSQFRPLKIPLENLPACHAIILNQSKRSLFFEIESPFISSLEESLNLLHAVIVCIPFFFWLGIKKKMARQLFDSSSLHQCVHRLNVE